MGLPHAVGRARPFPDHSAAGPQEAGHSGANPNRQDLVSRSIRSGGKSGPVPWVCQAHVATTNGHAKQVRTDDGAGGRPPYTLVGR